MAWVAIDKDKTERIWDRKPQQRYNYKWDAGQGNIQREIELPPGSIKKLIGHTLTWEDEPVELLKC